MGTRRIVLAMVLSMTSSCTVLEDLEGYAGGADGQAPDEDTGTPPEDTLPSVDADAPADTAAGDATLADTALADTKVSDTGVADTKVADTAVADTKVSDTAVADTVVAEAAVCTPWSKLGLSEVMVRVVSGTGDKREWLELTNYESSPLDIGGATVKVIGSAIEKASFTFPAGTVLAAGEALVVAVDKASFLGDFATPPSIKVFDFAKISDVMTNTTAFDVRLFAPGCTVTPYENITLSRGTWTLAQSFAYPVPSSACPAADRINAAGGPTTPWKDTTKDVANNFGSLTVGGVTTQLYGTPGRPNAGVVCP